jgi:hypothetical protein
MLRGSSSASLDWLVIGHICVVARLSKELRSGVAGGEKGEVR